MKICSCKNCLALGVTPDLVHKLAREQQASGVRAVALLLGVNALKLQDYMDHHGIRYPWRLISRH